MENRLNPTLTTPPPAGLFFVRLESGGSRHPTDRAVQSILGMQTPSGGWGPFDADNTHYYLNHIPFADHGALLDPPTADVSGRCLGFLAQLGFGAEHQAVARVLDFLRREQEPD